MQRRNPSARTILKAFLATLVPLAVAATGVVAWPLLAHARPAPGSAAPDFALKTTAGRNLRLSEYRGDVVVLSFWASWCGPCRETLTRLDTLPGTAGVGVPVVLGVNVEGDAGRAESVARSLGLRHPTLVDAGRSVSRLYDVDRLPLTLLLDREGVVRGVWSAQVVPGEEIARQIEELNR